MKCIEQTVKFSFNFYTVHFHLDRFVEFWFCQPCSFNFRGERIGFMYGWNFSTHILPSHVFHFVHCLWWRQFGNWMDGPQVFYKNISQIFQHVTVSKHLKNALVNILNFLNKIFLIDFCALFVRLNEVRWQYGAILPSLSNSNITYILLNKTVHYCKQQYTLSASINKYKTDSCSKTAWISVFLSHLSSSRNISVPIQLNYDSSCNALLCVT